LLQHRPTYTFGRRPQYEHALAGLDELQARGADVVESDRGGDVTFHGPGQLVAYPVLDLRARRLGPVDYVRLLEATIIDVLDSFGIAGERVPGRPGVWAAGAKIAAVGVRVQGGVSTHGFALNVETDLTWFDSIVPCGLRDARITSIERVLGTSPGVHSVESAVCRAFARAFDSELMPGPVPVLEEAVLSGR
jgi:lipoate-protein ligase B